MAKYNVTYSCGHSGTEALFGPHRDHERRVEWLEAFGLCPDCFAAQLQQRREAANTEALRWATENGMPVLEGTEKQCAWAETIRRQRLEEFTDPFRTKRSLASVVSDDERGFLTKLRESPYDPVLYGIFSDWLEEHGRTGDADQSRAFYWLLQQTEAKFWIDGRYKSTRDILREKIEEPERLEREEEERKRKAEAEAAERAAKEEKTRKLWDAKRQQTEKCLAFLRRTNDEQFCICVWGGSDQRVYIRTTTARFGSNRVEFFRTGNSKRKPGSLVLSEITAAQIATRRSVPAEQVKADIRSLCEELCAFWKSVEFTTTEAIG